MILVKYGFEKLSGPSPVSVMTREGFTSHGPFFSRTQKGGTSTPVLFRASDMRSERAEGVERELKLEPKQRCKSQVETVDINW